VIKERAEGEVIVFKGAGRGKTDAALGVSCRSVAHGGRVIFIHFAVPGISFLSELRATSEFGNSWKTVIVKHEAGITPLISDFAETLDTPAQALELAQKKWLFDCDLLVLDDIAQHFNKGNVGVEQVIAIVNSRPRGTSIILTGEVFPAQLTEQADLVTEFRNIK